MLLKLLKNKRRRRFNYPLRDISFYHVENTREHLQWKSQVKVMGEGCKELGEQMVSVREDGDGVSRDRCDLAGVAILSEEETKRRKRQTEREVKKTRQRRGASEDEEDG